MKCLVLSLGAMVAPAQTFQEFTPTAMVCTLDLFNCCFKIISLCYPNKPYWIGSNQPLDRESAQEVKRILTTQIGDQKLLNAIEIFSER